VKSGQGVDCGGVAVDDEFEHLVVLVEVDHAWFFSYGQHQTQTAVAVGFGPQVIEGFDHDVVVRGDIQRAMKGGMGAQPVFTPFPGDRDKIGQGRALTADELETVAKITVTFRVLGTRSSSDTGSTVLTNDVYVRTADPNAEDPQPTCATT